MYAQGNFSLSRQDTLKIGVADYVETSVCIYQVAVQYIGHNVIFTVTRRTFQIS
jgi:hypothetical protein